jgi:PEP-CTERM motif
MIFYSFDSNGAPADVGPLSVSATTAFAIENANGSFHFVVPPPGTNIYDGVSSAVPEPSTWAMMLLGFAGLGFAFRHSRRKVSFA